ncbi:MAG: ABC transporter permease [Nocardioidaceae bacterium]
MTPNLLTRLVNVGFALLVAAYLVLPSLVVIPLSFSTSMFLEFPPPGYSTRWFGEFFADPQWRDALVRSVVVAACSACIAVPVGLTASFGLLRARGRAGRALEPLVMVPMMIPVVISGFGMYVVSLRLDMGGSILLVVLAHAVLALPFVVVTVTAALRTFDFRLVLAARVSGASPLTAFRKVVLPVIAPAVGAATLIALMMSLDEAVIATFVAGDTSPTLPVMMFSSITYELNPLVPVAATLLTAATGLMIFAAALLARLGRTRSDIPRDPQEATREHEVAHG